MKYTYVGTYDYEVIEKYEIENNKIIIYFLDGYKQEIDYSKENEEKILNRMFNQAKNFVLNSKEKDRYTFSFYMSHILVAVIYCKILESEKPDYSFWGRIGMTTLYLVLYDLVKYCYYSGKGRTKKRYIEKYKRFIEMYDDLAEYGAETSQTVTVNDIDKLSLTEIKRLKKSIDNYKEKQCNEILKSFNKCNNISELLQGVLYLGSDKINMEELSSKLKDLPLSKVKKIEKRIETNNRDN